jgi:flagellar basal-body rod protein FlgF
LDNVSYIGVSRQMTLRRELDLAANNIANADTVGFKVEQLLVQTEAGAPARTDGIPNPALFVLDNGVGRDFGQGDLRQTGRPLDVAVEGDAFFRVGGAQGERYTRDGRFATDAQGRLVTKGGQPVLDDSGAEILLDPKKSEPSIAADGVVSQDGQRVAKLGVARFDSLSVLSKDGDNLYVNQSNAAAQPAPDARLRQGMLEGSNVRPIVEITNLIQVSRAYESVARMIEQNNDLTQRSVERLGRVS